MPDRSGQFRQCVICGKTYDAGKLAGKSGILPKYCSQKCRQVKHTATHRNYVRNNSKSVNRSKRDWQARVWGCSKVDDNEAHKTEVFAIEKILPLLGLTEPFHVAALHRWFPFDIIATDKNHERVLIDVTTGLHKGGPQHKRAVEIAKALMMPSYVLFVKPDFTAYQLRQQRTDQKGIMVHLDKLLSVL